MNRVTGIGGVFFKAEDPVALRGDYFAESKSSFYRRAPMTTISNKPVILINLFTVEPANQQQLLDLLTDATETSVRNAPGFISAKLHRSLDGTKVTMYARWRSLEDYQAMRENPDPLPYLQKALAIAKFEPGIYQVVETFCAAAGDA